MTTNEPISDEVLSHRVSVWRMNGKNISATSRALGLQRSTVRLSLSKAIQRGLMEDGFETPDAPALQDYNAAKDRKLAAFDKKQRKGNWRKPVMCNIQDGPFRLKLFGDPHLDADGCNYELFERHWLEMDVEKRIFGVCVGDWFNNWLKALGHLWREESTHPSDAWMCLEYLMEQRGDALLAACSGNHDDWTHGPADPIDLLMKRHGVIYRKGAVRVLVQAGDADPVTVALRHKWKGSSMYSAAHWGVRANREGWRDLILVGGHIHQDESRLVSHPDGFKSHVCQISSFKEYDEFADIHGFNGPKISPVWDLVIDPREADTSPDKVKIFWNSEKAQAYLEAIS